MSCCGCFEETVDQQFTSNKAERHRNRFRTFVHPEMKMRDLVTRAGFDLVSRRRTFAWSVDVFIRREDWNR